MNGSSGFLLIILGLALLAPCSWGREVRRGKTEFRAAWMNERYCNTKEKCDNVLRLAEKAHLNALLPIIEKWEFDFDYVAYLSVEGKKRGLDVHVWYINAQDAKMKIEMHNLKENIYCVGYDGAPDNRWVDLALPVVRRLEARDFVSILDRWPLVAGVHHDYIRYAGNVGNRFCYCEHCRRSFEAKYEVDPLVFTGGRFPVADNTAGNPVTHLKDATVIVEFADDGTPAVFMKEHGKGRYIHFNFEVTRWSSTTMEETVRLLIGHYVPHKENPTVYIFDNYGKQEMSWVWKLQRWAKRYAKTQVIPLRRLKDLQSGIVLMTDCYVLDQETVDAIKAFVTKGGTFVSADGLVLTKEREAARKLSELIGAKNMGFSYYHGPREMRVVTDMPWIPKEGKGDPAKAKQYQARWDQWRKDQVTELVRACYRAVRRKHRRKWVSAAIFSNKQAMDSVLQDAYRWLNEGLLDFMIPMNYQASDGKWKQTNESFIRDLKAPGDLARCCSGVGCFKDEHTPENVVSKIRIGRELGFRGFVIFELGKHFTDEVAEALAQGPYAERVPPYYPPKRRRR